MSVAKSKSALKRAFKYAADGQYTMTVTEAMRALRFTLAVSPSDSDEVMAVFAVAENLLRKVGSVANEGVRAANEVAGTSDWATKSLADSFFGDVDEYKYNPRRR